MPTMLFGQTYDDETIHADVTASTVVVLPHGSEPPGPVGRTFETSTTCGLRVDHLAAEIKDTVVCRVRDADGRWMGDVELPSWTTFVMGHDRWVAHVHDVVARYLSGGVGHMCGHEGCGGHG